jgi:uncharacterized protein YneF (UPF0154 family)
MIPWWTSVIWIVLALMAGTVIGLYWQKKRPR